MRPRWAPGVLGNAGFAPTCSKVEDFAKEIALFEPNPREPAEFSPQWDIQLIHPSPKCELTPEGMEPGCCVTSLVSHRAKGPHTSPCLSSLLHQPRFHISHGNVIISKISATVSRDQNHNSIKSDWIGKQRVSGRQARTPRAGCHSPGEQAGSCRICRMVTPGEGKAALTPG